MSLPLDWVGGDHILPDDLKKAVAFTATHSVEEIRSFRGSQMSLRPEWGLPDELATKVELRTRAKIHPPSRYTFR